MIKAYAISAMLAASVIAPDSTQLGINKASEKAPVAKQAKTQTENKGWKLDKRKIRV